MLRDVLAPFERVFAEAPGALSGDEVELAEGQHCARVLVLLSGLRDPDADASVRVGVLAVA